jgi:hypothetical protein
MTDNGILIHTMTTIDAPVETVWAVLSDLTRYGDWNPVLKIVDGTAALGNVITMRGLDEELSPSNFEATISSFSAPNVLAWEVGDRNALHGLHRFEISANGAGTSFVNDETFSGPGAAGFIDEHRTGVTDWNKTFNAALKDTAEKK